MNIPIGPIPDPNSLSNDQNHDYSPEEPPMVSEKTVEKNPYLPLTSDEYQQISPDYWQFIDYQNLKPSDERHIKAFLSYCSHQWKKQRGKGATTKSAHKIALKKALKKFYPLRGYPMLIQDSLSRAATAILCGPYAYHDDIHNKSGKPRLRRVECRFSEIAKLYECLQSLHLKTLCWCRWNDNGNIITPYPIRHFEEKTGLCSTTIQQIITQWEKRGWAQRVSPDGDITKTPHLFLTPGFFGEFGLYKSLEKHCRGVHNPNFDIQAMAWKICGHAKATATETFRAINQFMGSVLKPYGQKGVKILLQDLINALASHSRIEDGLAMFRQHIESAMS